MIYFIVSTTFFILGVLIILWIHNQRRLDIIVEPISPPPHAPLISICIPARNEERNIRVCIESALAQDYPNLEVIVLDDRSTDSTLEILRGIAALNDKLRIISGSDLPKGWAGKPHALFQASAAAKGAWLCFVDADTFVAREALSACHAKAVEMSADMFTIMTFQVARTFWEKIVMPPVMTALSVGFPPRKVNDPNRKDAIANGQFILIKREVYDAIGGHSSVKGSIVEDKAIAERVKWNGYRLVLADGSKVARTRMYTSLSEIWEGWTKNMYLGLRDQPSLLLLGIFGALIAFIAALILPAWTPLGIFWYLRSGGWMALAVIIQSLILWAVLLYARAQVAISMKISPWYALTTPLGAAVFAGMMVTSAWRVISRQGVTWKGRIYREEKAGKTGAGFG